MDTVLRIVVLTVTSNVLAFDFGDFMKNFPISADIKAVIMDMQKQQETFMPPADGVTSADFKSGTPFNARKNNEIIKPTSTVLAKVVTKRNTPVTQRNRVFRPPVTLRPGGSCQDMVKMTGKPTEEPSTARPPFMAIPIFPSVPVMIPMRTYYEKVEHDHPPLHKIKQLIEEDNKKWEEENNEGVSDISVVIDDEYDDTCSDQSYNTNKDTDTSTETDTDTDTDSSSLSKSSDAGPDYYDDLIKIKVGGRDR